MSSSREYMRAYRDKNRERIRAQQKAWTAANRDRVRASAKAARAKPENVARAKAWREANKEHLAEYLKKRQKELGPELAAKQRAYYAANKTRYQRYERERRYGLDAASFEALLAKQQSRCACCGRKRVKLFIDHCHTSGVVRGLLCLNCNTMIGHAHDSASRLEAGAKYLRKSRYSEHLQRPLFGDA